MFNCKDCEHAVFDETWGEYKCKFHGHVIYKPETKENCEGYKQNKSKKK